MCDVLRQGGWCFLGGGGVVVLQVVCCFTPFSLHGFTQFQLCVVVVVVAVVVVSVSNPCRSNQAGIKLAGADLLVLRLVVAMEDSGIYQQTNDGSMCKRHCCSFMQKDGNWTRGCNVRKTLEDNLSLVESSLRDGGGGWSAVTPREKHEPSDLAGDFPDPRPLHRRRQQLLSSTVASFEDVLQHFNRNFAARAGVVITVSHIEQLRGNHPY